MLYDTYGDEYLRFIDDLNEILKQEGIEQLVAI